MGRSPEDHAEDEAFEEEVLRIARAIFAPHRPDQGSTMLSGQERDAQIEGEDIVVAIEATTSRAKEKAEKDGKKLKQQCEYLANQFRFKAVKGYFITRDEPTAQQRDAINALKGPITVCSLSQFRGQLIDSRDYLESRFAYPFGSARNPQTDSTTELEAYVPLGFSVERSRSNTKRTLGIGDITSRMSEGATTLLLGDFGAGKSMSMREVHRNLAKRHFKDPLSPFPMTINLRDHQGQDDTDEAIRRHANRLGFANPTKLVRAWRAGQVHVLLDGFDEIAASGWRGRTPDLTRIRRGSVELVRRFAEETPATAGMMISGRRHFFDSDREMLDSLGVSSRRAEIVYTDEFNEEQVAKYLEDRSWTGNLPEWLPTHPLLLGYLASKDTLAALATDDDVDSAHGWDYLLDQICAREARIEQGLDGATIRRVLERLASMSRGRGSGRGPILPADLAVAFEQVASYPPDEGSYQVLQRLPGLGVQDATNGARSFIDDSLLDAARSGDVVRFAAGVEDHLETAIHASVPMGALGLSVAVVQSERLRLTPAQANSAAQRLHSRGTANALVLDMVRLGSELGPSRPGVLEFSDVEIEIFTIDDSETDFAALTFRDCYVGTLDLTEHDGTASLPFFVGCEFGTVLGAASAASLPDGRFSECNFEAFDPSSKTTRGILAMPSLSPKQKVVLTILKKIYLQAGAGRKASALVRGLGPELRDLVPAAVEHLRSYGLITEPKTAKKGMYAAVRGQRARVRALLESSGSSNDEVITSLR